MAHRWATYGISIVCSISKALWLEPSFPAQSVPDGSKRKSYGHWPGLDLQCVAPCMIIYMEVQEDGKDSLLIDGWRMDAVDKN